MADLFQAMCHVCEARRVRWPSGDDPFQAISRLAEECGELARAVNHQERTGIKIEKHGEPDPGRIAAEAADVMLCALQLVRHYNLVSEFDRLIEAKYRSYGGVGDSTD